MSDLDQRSSPRREPKPRYVSMTMRLPPEWFAHLGKLAKVVGKSPAACARSLLIDVLRDDAIAHGAAVADAGEDG